MLHCGRVFVKKTHWLLTIITQSARGLVKIEVKCGHYDPTHSASFNISLFLLHPPIQLLIETAALRRGIILVVILGSPTAKSYNFVSHPRSISVNTQICKPLFRRFCLRFLFLSFGLLLSDILLMRIYVLGPEHHVSLRTSNILYWWLDLFFNFFILICIFWKENIEKASWEFDRLDVRSRFCGAKMVQSCQKAPETFGSLNELCLQIFGRILLLKASKSTTQFQISSHCFDRVSPQKPFNHQSWYILQLSSSSICLNHIILCILFCLRITCSFLLFSCSRYNSIFLNKFSIQLVKIVATFEDIYHTKTHFVRTGYTKLSSGGPVKYLPRIFSKTQLMDN